MELVHAYAAKAMAYLPIEWEEIIVKMDNNTYLFRKMYLEDLARNSELEGQELMTAAFAWYLRDLVDEMEDLNTKLRTKLGWDGMYLEAKRMLEDLEDLLEDSAWTVIDNVHQEVYA